MTQNTEKRTKQTIGQEEVAKDFVNVTMTNSDGGEITVKTGISALAIIHTGEDENTQEFSTALNGQFSTMSLIAMAETALKIVISELKQEGIGVGESLEILARISKSAIDENFTDEDKMMMMLEAMSRAKL